LRERARVAVQDFCTPFSSTNAGELPDPGNRVERIAAEKLSGRLHGTAHAAMLVAPVRLELRGPRKIEIEVRRAACRSRGACEDDSEDVCVLVLIEDRAPEQELGRGFGGEPEADVGS
jgi:hypothetical protein